MRTLTDLDIHQIREEKDGHEEKMIMYAQNCRDHVGKYGPTPCDYLIHRQRMESYHRGGYNTALSILKILGV